MALTTDEHAPKLDDKTFAPAPPRATFSPPPAWIDPDPSKGWIRRLLPVLRPHRRVLIGSMVASVVMLALQLSIPQVLRGAIDNSITVQNEPLGPYVIVMIALGQASGNSSSATCSASACSGRVSRWSASCAP